MTMTHVEEEILSREKSYWDAMKSKNGSAAAALTADPSLVVSADGIREVTPGEIEEMVKSGPYELQDYGVEGGDVKFVNSARDVALVAYKVRSNYVMDGKPQRIEAYDTSVWVRRDGAWVCALHTETTAASKPPAGKVGD